MGQTDLTSMNMLFIIMAILLVQLRSRLGLPALADEQNAGPGDIGEDQTYEEYNEYEDSTELDILIDDIINEENMIEEELYADDYDYENFDKENIPNEFNSLAAMGPYTFTVAEILGLIFVVSITSLSLAFILVNLVAFCRRRQSSGSKSVKARIRMYDSYDLVSNLE